MEYKQREKTSAKEMMQEEISLVDATGNKKGERERENSTQPLEINKAKYYVKS